MTKISIVTPTYNRAEKVVRSINSSLKLIEDGFADELIVVDDGSVDNTKDVLHSCFNAHIASGNMKIICLADNYGVTGAKNIGAQHASGDWVVFMDSDDLFSVDAGGKIEYELFAEADASIIFFRCIDKDGSLIGRPVQKTEMDIRSILNNGLPGECLPIIKRAAILKYPYLDFLRGCESTAYFEVISSGHRCVLSDKTARVYDDKSTDRLSTRINVLRRSGHLSVYYKIVMGYSSHLDLKNYLLILLKRVVYTLFSYVPLKL